MRGWKAWARLSGLAASLALWGAVLWTGQAWYQERDARLTGDPPRRAAQLTLPPRDSEGSVRLRIPFAVLQQAAERDLPAEFSQSGEGDGTRYSFTLRRTAPIRFRAVDGQLRATTSLQVNGQAGLTGGVASLLGLDAKNFDAAADIEAEIQATLDADWCPAVAVRVGYQWSKAPRLEIIGGVWVGIEERVRALVDEALRNLPQTLKDNIPCERLREAAAEQWRRHDIPVQLPAAPPLLVQIEPQALGSSELAVEPNHLRLVLALQARTAVTERAAATPARQIFLPPLRQVPDRDGRIALSIPIRAGYDMIRDWIMREFGHQDIPVQLGGVTAVFRVQALTVYPSDPNIALAVEFSAALPGRVLNTTGRVIFTAKPVVEQRGSQVRLTDIQFARDFDNPLWSLATATFEDRIRAALSDVAVYDLKDIIAGALTELRRRLADPAVTGRLRVTLTRPALRLERLVMENDALTVLGTAEAGIEAEVTALP
ncbi:hypothetical protein BKE38_15630 [Pseudoroseomonas deserti]|uniref:DUF4403 domain-containing protein n=1 Tax=Teichococcus deserti TaxID=1817963 RepID=A0A1V2H0A8_9PROT|nr:DUF4403 family protein [Pseudoroseomonas deserti]ONG51795.1 hypothetical protein BKE38_15630 [Pseudoroseomonas deserti]